MLFVPATSVMAAETDPYLWLESVDGKKALDWVQQQNKISTHELAESPAFQTMNARFRTILDSDARIPFVTRLGNRYYNFWKDAKHERGIWRRTTLEEYRKANPAWETVLDVDQLARDEKENWIWNEARTLPTDYSRTLIALSRGGGDAVVFREFDLTTKKFVTGGFSVPESKSEASWIDKDHLFLGPAIDSTTMTTSGYPKVAQIWTRGTPIASAKQIYETIPSDVAAAAFRDHTPGFERDFVERVIDFYNNELFLYKDGKLTKIAKPVDADATPWREWMLLHLRTDWQANGKTYTAGSLVAAKLADMLAGKPVVSVVFQPTERTSLAGFSPTKSAVVLDVLDNVRSREFIARPASGAWSQTAVSGLPQFSSIGSEAVDERDSDDFWLRTNDFLTPPSLSLGHVSGGAPEKLKSQPQFFDADKSEVSQHEAISKDGTRVPYFEVAPKGLKLDGNAPTMLTGYGGFEIPELPAYSGLRGSGWIEKGGVLVVANIRGGGEFGPKWHQAAMKVNRPRAYEDFIAVGEDLVKRKVTSPAHLGCIGGSNGGLLVGNMLTRRPDLFGAIVCESPLLDMHRYHKLLAGASWMSEYGDPDKPSDWAFISGFSPYENVKKGVKYPRTLFTSSTLDDRVHPGHARKMVAKMEAQGHDVLYYENVEGGHGGSATNKERAFMDALAYTFMWNQLTGAPGKGAAGQAATTASQH
jgi:prolyl oligopeptidase